jgi:hypothetical protein
MFLYVADTGTPSLARLVLQEGNTYKLSTHTTYRGFNMMGTHWGWVLNMYDTDFGPVRNDVYANFKQQSLSREADCKKIYRLGGGKDTVME